MRKSVSCPQIFVSPLEILPIMCDRGKARMGLRGVMTRKP